MHCVKSVRIRSFSGPYIPAFGLNTDQENSKYGHFPRSDGAKAAKVSILASVLRRSRKLFVLSISIIVFAYSVGEMTYPDITYKMTYSHP